MKDMLELSLPGFDYKVKKQNGTVMIFDIVRKKYVVLTPEEWVRQHVVHYLVEKKGYAISRVAVEREIELYGLKRRFDIVVFDRSGNPWLLVECKAPAVALTQKVFDHAETNFSALGIADQCLPRGVNQSDRL